MRRFVTAAAKLLGITAVVGAMGLLVFLGLGPHTGQYRTMTVLTDSMRPTMPAGSVAVQTPMPVSDVEVGDVITYRIPVDDQRIVTHRIVEVLERGDKPVVVTQGDAVSVPDPWTARLEGPVVWRTEIGVPALGYVLQAARQPVVRQVLVLGAPVLLALVWLADIWWPPQRRLRSVHTATEAPGPGPTVAIPAGASLARTLAIAAPIVLATAWAERSARAARTS